MSSLQQKVEKTQKAKYDQSLGTAVKFSGAQLAPLRMPPMHTKLRRTLKGHFGKVTAMHWGGDSRLLVSAGQDGNLLVWNTVSSNKLNAVQLKSSYVMSVGMEQSKGDMVACGGLDNLCTVYHWRQPEKATELVFHDGFLSCCRFLSEQQILTSSGDSNCILWDIATSRNIVNFTEHAADALHMSLKPGDKHSFASCSVDGTVKVWDIRKPGGSVMTFTGHSGDVNCVEFMPSDGNALGTCGQDGTVRLFDLRACNQLASYGGVNNESEMEGFTKLSFSGSGRLLFVGHSDGNVYAYDVLADRAGPAFALQGAHDKAVSSIGVSPRGNALCTASWDGVLKIWA